MKNTLNYSVNAICPACGYSIATKIFSDKQPLSTIGWPKDAHQASSMKSLPLDFVRCNDCGHIHNTSFDYKEVPYSKKPRTACTSSTLRFKKNHELPVFRVPYVLKKAANCVYFVRCQPFRSNSECASAGPGAVL